MIFVIFFIPSPKDKSICRFDDFSLWIWGMGISIIVEHIKPIVQLQLSYNPNLQIVLFYDSSYDNNYWTAKASDGYENQADKWQLNDK